MNWGIKPKKFSSVKQSYWKAKKVPVFMQRNDDKKLGGKKDLFETSEDADKDRVRTAKDEAYQSSKSRKQPREPDPDNYYQDNWN